MLTNTPRRPLTESRSTLSRSRRFAVAANTPSQFPTKRSDADVCWAETIGVAAIAPASARPIADNLMVMTAPLLELPGLVSVQRHTANRVTSPHVFRCRRIQRPRSDAGAPRVSDIPHATGASPDDRANPRGGHGTSRQ